MPQIVIATALVLEARVIARAFSFASTRFAQKIEHHGGISVAVIGPGARQVERVRSCPCQGVIMAGLGGALAPELKLGDVVVDGDVPAVFPGLGHRMFVGPIRTSEKIVATPEEKSQLFRTTGALAVDMETAAARLLAERMQVPFLAVRAISDTAAQALDEDLLTLVDTEGRTRTGRAVGMLLRRPSRLRELMALRRASRVALANLAATVEAVVREGWPRTS